ncbi:MAG: DUF4124 domain-containing protein [Thermodesulfovibrionales bacterium]|nr:DUF4124 domain-containing protein [Thermodesulfovibrionales bacterium]
MVCLSFLLALCPAKDASGEVRKYVDDKGNVHLTDKEYPAEKGTGTHTSSSGMMYSYLDEHGRMHLTNDKGKILPQYMDSLKEIKGIERRSEILSTKISNAFSGQREDAWLKYKQMGWFKKNALIARAGFTDIKGVLDDLKLQMLFITVLFIGMGVFAIIKLKKISHMVSVIVMLLSCYGMVYLSIHIKSTMGRGSDILSNLSQMKALAQGQTVSVEGGGGTSSAKAVTAGQGGIMGSIRHLQDMNSERQDLFRMILEEDNI